jgi:hypothetical protein
LLVAFAAHNEDEADFATCLDEWKAEKGQQVKVHIKSFFANLTKSNAAPQEIADAWQFLFNGACSLEGAVAPPALVDCSYFFPRIRPGSTSFIFDWRKLCPTSDVVSAVALELWLEHRTAEVEDWRQPLIELSSARNVNPSVAGFVDEKIALSILPQIELNLTYHDEKSTDCKLCLNVAQKKSISFLGRWDPRDLKRVIPDLEARVVAAASSKKCLQFDPALWNYAHADSILVSGSSPSTIVAVQATYQKPTSQKKAFNTAQFFMTSQWKKFTFGGPANWQKVILWITGEDSPALRTDLPSDIFQAQISFEALFHLARIPYF